MNDDEKKEIIQAIKDNSHTRQGDNILKNVTSLIMALCTVGIVWLMDGVSTMKQDLSASKEWRISVSQKMNNFDSFTRSPRFTRENFNNAIVPLNMEIMSLKQDSMEFRKELERLRREAQLNHKPAN